MAFHEVQFPVDISYGSTGTIERRTLVVNTSSGYEERWSQWQHSKRTYDAGLGLRSLDDMYAAVQFYEARLGRLHGFRWKDWADYKSLTPNSVPAANDQTIGTGDGAETIFQITKTYSSGGFSYIRDIKKPVSGTVLVEVNLVAQTEGVDFTVNTVTGEITFTSPPTNTHLITAGYEFDVPARFEIDKLRIDLVAFEAGTAPEIPITEIRI